MNHFKIIMGIILKLFLIFLMIISISLAAGPIIEIFIVLFGESAENWILGDGEFFFDVVWGNIAIILAIFIVYKIFKKKDNFSLGWKEGSIFDEGIEGSLWGILLITIPFISIWLLGGFKVADFSFNLEVLKSIGLGIILFLFVAISEELLVRGYYQGLVKKKYGVITAIVSGSFIFSLFHILNENVLQNPIPLIVLFLAGILLGVSREVTGSLWVPIGIHFTWNFFQGYIYGFEVSGKGIGSSLLEIERRGQQLISGGKFGLEGSIITAIVLLLAIYHHWWFYKGRYQKVEV